MARKAKILPSAAMRVHEAAFELARIKGWRRTTMPDIAETSGLDLGELLKLYRSKSALLHGIIDNLDKAALGTIPANSDTPDETPRDRLFDIILARFDALNPNKAGLIAIVRGEASNPVAGVCHLLRLRRSIVLMLEAAGLSSGGIGGQLRLKGLGLIYANALRVWLSDDSQDMAKTMAAVDQGLAKAEKIAGLCSARLKPSSNLSD